MKVVPFGANLTGNRDLDAIDDIIRNRGTDVAGFFLSEWIGSERGRHRDCYCRRPPRPWSSDRADDRRVLAGRTGAHAGHRQCSWFYFQGFAIGGAEIEQLLASSHFLVAPTRAECFGVAFAEASSFALPSIASNVMGVPSVVSDGVNGFTFPLKSIVADSVSCMASLWADRPRYESLCWSAFEESRNRLNWEASGRDLILLLGEMHPSRTVLSEQPEGMAGSGSGQL